MVHVCIGSRKLLELWKTKYVFSQPSILTIAVCIRNQDIYIGPPSLVDDEAVKCSDIDVPSPTRPTLVDYLISMAKFSRIVRKVLKVVSLYACSLVADVKSYSAESTKLSLPVWTEELHNLTLELSVHFSLYLTNPLAMARKSSNVLAYRKRRRVRGPFLDDQAKGVDSVSL